MPARYFEDFTPGRGRLAPHAVLDSDAPRIDLNGPWAFRFSSALLFTPEPLRPGSAGSTHRFR
ncbi:hypothetical protein [Streptomyces longisporus]|uniref:hypothetical protein n=1 Tax=Streptomyces longisporus TaxID=1948 RepID=UPI0031D9A078